MPAIGTAPSRHAFIDHLRITLTALVILHHTAIVYGGSGGWYWREQPNGSKQLLLFFNAVNQSFFMGFFFLLAGYYTPASFARKGARRYLADRFLRLGLPLLGYFLILSPLTIALARTGEGHPFWSGWWLMTRLAEFEPGPLWFAEALLILAVLYAITQAWVPRVFNNLARVPAFAILAVAAFGVGTVSFLVRLAVPVGESIAWLQLGYFPAYLLLFVTGCAAARAHVLEHVTFAAARPWAIVSVIMLLLLPVVIATRGALGGFEGGWNLNAAIYAYWDPLVAWGIILVLLWSYRRFWSMENRVTAQLGRSAYAAYIVHPPVVVALSLLGRNWTAAPLLKFGVIGCASVIAAFALAAAVLSIPGVRRIL